MDCDFDFIRDFCYNEIKNADLKKVSDFIEKDFDSYFRNQISSWNGVSYLMRKKSVNLPELLKEGESIETPDFLNFDDDSIEKYNHEVARMIVGEEQEARREFKGKKQDAIIYYLIDRMIDMFDCCRIKKKKAEEPFIKVEEGNIIFRESYVRIIYDYLKERGNGDISCFALMVGCTSYYETEKETYYYKEEQ